ncbi:M23 family metallopeptidase [Tepidiforma sp.]|uniref:M23 family metallopeptidase n=1 Tax=Tepidiforma sp. TaxID=2682230 RepID=UPI002ADD6F44|nr:M23 family metallopeptidase [Tepidiforma sp.]
MDTPTFGPAVLERANYIGLPISGTITATFGSRTIPEHAGGHTGVDIAAPAGTPVRAPAAGVVVDVRSGDTVFGQAVELAHPGGWRTHYAHLQRVDVRVGQAVRAGDGLGLCGSTGLSTGPHLHWGLARGHSPAVRGPGLADPLAYVVPFPPAPSRERQLRAAAAAIYAGLQAAGALFASQAESDLEPYPPGSDEQLILAIQRAANPFLARWLPPLAAIG